MFWYDYQSYIFFVLPAILIALFAQIKVKSTYNQYSKVHSSRGFTADQIARMILDRNGLFNVSVERISGSLTDHYDPSANVIRLSDSVSNSTSVAAIGVAAHEVGHAIQHSQDYFPMKIRKAIIPASQIGSTLSFPLVLIGLFMSFKPLVFAGIVLFSLVVVFQLVTLPVEFNASSRALATLRDDMILQGDELKGAKKVLGAAAMTYVAALLVSLGNLLRLLSIANRRN